MPVAIDPPTLGEGAYTFPEAARILGGITTTVTTTQLRRWMSSGLAPAATSESGHYKVLSFDDLISLAIIGRFRISGVSLQKVRKLERELRKRYPGHDRPFAYRTFFTDGASVWVEVMGEDDAVIEVAGKRRFHFAWKSAIQTFAREIRYGEDRHAQAWNLTPWVEINPHVQFGMPVVTGTRVPVRTIVANLEVGTPREVAGWYGLTVGQVNGARDYYVTNR